MSTLNRPMIMNQAMRSARTHEGAAVTPSKPMEEFRRAVLTTLLFENSFYENGVTSAARIEQLAKNLPIKDVLALATEARKVHGLRGVPLWILNACLDHPARTQPANRKLLVEAIANICDRADMPGELLAQYWAKGKRPIASVLKEGLAQSLTSFAEYNLAKYANKGSIRPRDVLFLTHAKPKNKEQAITFAALANDELKQNDTWEDQLSAGGNKKEVFTDLMRRGKLGAVALLRNLRNMEQAGVDRGLVKESLAKISGGSRILPFQFIAAARAVPRWEDLLEEPMLASVNNLPKLKGKTVLLVDVSGSMNGLVSQRSTISRLDAARALAILCREVCDEVVVVAFNGQVRDIPARRGFGLAEAIPNANGSTDINRAVTYANSMNPDRVIIFTDEQSGTPVGQPKGRGYIMNVAGYRNGIGWGKWVTISGFSDQLIKFIHEVEHVLE